MSGEVSEREDLLDGRVRVEIEGGDAGTGGAEGWTLTASFGWRRGRDGEVALDEGDLTLACGAREVYASIDGGTARPDPETAAVHVRARFVVDGSTGGWLRPGARLSGEFAIRAVEWEGDVRLDAGEAPPPP